MSRQRTRHFAVALVLSVILTAASAMPAVARIATPSKTSSVTTTAAPAPAVVGAVAAHTSREIFGFALASSLSDPTVGYPSWNFDLLSTVAFFGVHVDTAGHFVGDNGWTVWNSASLSSLVSTAHQHGVKVLLGIILQDFSANTPNMCAGLTHIDATVAQAVAEVKAKGVDGVNIDYEGLDGSCGTGDAYWAQHAMTSMAQQMRTALGASSYIAIDTYSGAAADGYGFFDIAGLAAYVDSMFVMAYDMEYSNYSSAPLYCSSFCLGPTSPLTAYRYNDAGVVSDYVAKVPAGKVILGVPYYGRKACVAGANSPNQYPTSSVVADSYLDAAGEAAYYEVKAGTYAVHRETNSAGMERWDTWFNTTLSCTRELYWDDAISLGKKYDLVNATGIRGVGIWNLNYGGGAPELWAALQGHFLACTGAAITVSPASPQSPGAQVRFTATSSTCPHPVYEFWMLPAGSSTWQSVQAYSGSATYDWNSTGAAAGTEHFGVWVRDAGGSGASCSSLGCNDTYAGIPFTVVPACTSVTASAAPATVAQGSGAHVVITGAAAGCPHPLYEFWMLPAGSSSWQLVQAYSTSATYDWNSAGAAAGAEHFGVWVRDAGGSGASCSNMGCNDAYASIPFTVVPGCTSVTASAAPATVAQGTGAHVVITGVATGCSHPVYEFWMLAAGSSAWQLVQAYSASATYDWNSAGAASGTEHFGVWVRDAGGSGASCSNMGCNDAYASIPFTVVPACASVTASAAPATVAHGSGTHVVITGVATGCPHPLYEFWMLPAGSSTWQLVQAYSTSATYDWNSSGAAAGTEHFGVWVRDAGGSGASCSNMGCNDTYASLPYTVT